jgi:hypothetical protein
MGIKKSSGVDIMNYTYKISKNVATGLEVNEFQNGQYYFHCTIFGLKNIMNTEQCFESKDNEYLNSLKRMKNWLLQNHPELIL